MFKVETVVAGDGHEELQLTDKQRQVIIGLAWWGCEWVRPMDIGGRNASHHSQVLNQLVRKGLVETKVRSRGVRGSKVYRLHADALGIAKELESWYYDQHLGRLARLAAKA